MNRVKNFYLDYEREIDNDDDGKIVFQEIRDIYKKLIESTSLRNKHKEAYAILVKIDIEIEIKELMRRYDMDDGEYFTTNGNITCLVIDTDAFI